MLGWMRPQDTTTPGDRFAVVIPAFNCENLVAAAVTSARDSGACEIVVVDDGSVDATAAVARDAGATVISQVNAGAAAARRTGFSAVSSDLILFLDADDRLKPEGVAEILRVLEPGQQDIVGGIAVGIDAAGRQTTFRPWPKDPTTYDLLVKGYSPSPPGVFIWPTGVVEKCFDDLPSAIWPTHAEDYELLLRGSLLTRIVVRPIPVLSYALEGGKSAGQSSRSFECAEEIRQHYGRLLGIPVPRTSKRRLKGRALIRDAKANSGGGPSWAWLRLVLLAAAKDPRFVLVLAIDGVRSRVRGAMRGGTNAG